MMCNSGRNPGNGIAMYLSRRTGRIRDVFMATHKGENLKYVQVQMGHSDIKVTLDVYGHLLKDANPAAAARTDRLVFGDTAGV